MPENDLLETERLVMIAYQLGCILGIASSLVNDNYEACADDAQKHYCPEERFFDGPATCRDVKKYVRANLKAALDLLSKE